MVASALIVCQYIAIVGSAAAGLTGILVDFKDKVGHITNWGRWALIGVIASLVLALVTKTLEVEQDAEKAQSDAAQALAAVQRAQLTLTGIDRAVHPFTDVYVSSRIRLPARAFAVAAFVAKLRQAMSSVRDLEDPSSSKAGFYVSELSGSGGSTRDIPTEVSVPDYSPLFPKYSPTKPQVTQRETAALAVLLNELKLDISVYDTLPKPPYSLRDKPGVLEFSDGGSSERRLTLRLDSGTVQLETVEPRVSDPKHWHSDGSILSTVDLVGKTLAFRPRISPYVTGDRTVDSLSEQAYAGTVLALVHLRIHNQDYYYLNPTRHTDAIDQFYTARFTDTTRSRAE